MTMINIKPEVLQALESNSVLVSLLGGSRIYQIKAPNADEFPRITFFELMNYDDHFADDQEISSEIRIQVDVWNKSSTSAIAQEVDKSLKSIGFGRSSSIDLYEDDTQIYHKAMRYTITREVI